MCEALVLDLAHRARLAAYLLKGILALLVRMFSRNRFDIGLGILSMECSHIKPVTFLVRFSSS